MLAALMNQQLTGASLECPSTEPAVTATLARMHAACPGSEDHEHHDHGDPHDDWLALVFCSPEVLEVVEGGCSAWPSFQPEALMFYPMNSRKQRFAQNRFFRTSKQEKKQLRL